MQKLLWAFFCVFLMVLPLAADSEKESDRVQESGQVMKEIIDIPDNIPKDLLDRAECVIVLPSVKKLAIGIGGSYGRGAMVCRTENNFSEPWGAPAMYALEGGSFGLQLGAEATDLVLLVMNKRGADAILRSKVKLGGDDEDEDRLAAIRAVRPDARLRIDANAGWGGLVPSTIVDLTGAAPEVVREYERIGPDDFRVLRQLHPDRLAELVKSDPVAVVIGLIRAHGGHIDADLLKPMRYPEIYPPEEGGGEYHPVAAARTMFEPRLLTTRTQASGAPPVRRWAPSRMSARPMC